MTFSNRSRKILSGTMITLFAAFSVVFVMAGSIIIAARKTPSHVTAIWNAHRNACLESPLRHKNEIDKPLSREEMGLADEKPIACSRRSPIYLKVRRTSEICLSL